MAAEPAVPATTEDDVRILPPDQTMQKKLGGAKLDTLFSNEAVQEAQQVIVESAADFITETLADLQTLEEATKTLAAAPEQNHQVLATVINMSFAIKAKAGLGGYNLVSTLAKSLNSRCELLGDASLTPTNLSIITWHVDSMRQMLTMKIKGMGGAVGQAIITELNTMAAAIGQTPPGV